MRSHGSIRRGLSVLVALTVGGVTEIASAHDEASQSTLLAVMTLLLIAFLWSEINHVRAEQPHGWLMDPVVITSVVTFALGFGLMNAVYYLPYRYLEMADLTAPISRSMVKLMWLVLLAAVAMWLGYRSSIGTALAKRCNHGFRHRWIRSARRPYGFAIPLLALLALAARLIQVRLGVFGYASNFERLIEMGKVTQYLSMLASLGPLSLALAALTHYWHPESRRHTILLAIVMAIELAFGLLSGFKSQVAMPFVILGICYYLRRGRIPVLWIGGFALAIAIAYAVIQPYRAIRNSQYAGAGDSATAIASSILNAQQGMDTQSRDHGPVWLQFMARSSLLYSGSLGVAYADAGNGLPPGSPHFLENLVLAPAYAIIPRALLPSKPVGDMGLWYTHVVMRRDIMSATAPSPFTYLYFAGGTFGVIAFFALFGVGLRMLGLLANPHSSIAAALVYLAILSKVATVPSAVDGMVVDIVRTVPLILLVQLALFPRQSQKLNRGLNSANEHTAFTQSHGKSAAN